MAVLQFFSSKFVVSGLGMHNRQASLAHEPSHTLEQVGVTIICGMPGVTQRLHIFCLGVVTRCQRRAVDR